MQCMPLKCTEMTVKVFTQCTEEFNWGLLMVLTHDIETLRVWIYTKTKLNFLLLLLTLFAVKRYYGLINICSSRIL